MCEPVTITAIVTSTAIAVEAAAAAAASAASAVAGAVTSAAAAIGIGGGAGGTAAAVGTTIPVGVSVGGGAGLAGSGLGGIAVGSVIAPGVSVGGAAGLTGSTVSAGLTIAEGVALVSLAAGVGQGIASGVQAEQQRKTAKNLNKKDAASKTVAALNARQQGAEASAKQQFQASRAALAAAGKIKASNLGDRSVAALSRAVGFELGTDKATIKRNQQIANLETSARLFGINTASESRRNLIGETGGLTLGLNTGATFINAGVNALKIRNALSN